MTDILKTAAGYDIITDGLKVGEIRYIPFWENMPYITKFIVDENCRGRGEGSKALKLLENNLRSEGNVAVLVSTQADENGQRFYRKNGYSECGCLILENTPFKQAMEMFFIKVL